MKFTLAQIVSMKPAEQFSVGMVQVGKRAAVLGGDLPDYAKLHSQVLWRRVGPVPDAKQWLRMYRRRRQVLAGVLAAFVPLEDRQDAVVLWLLAFRILRAVTMSADLRPVFEAWAGGGLVPTWAKRDLRWRLFRILTRLTRRVMKSPPERMSEEAMMRAIASSVEFRFLVCVEVPCWIQAGVTSSCLLRRARHGEAEAIKMLLRIDKSVMLDPKIQAHYYRAAQAREKWFLRAVAAGISKDMQGFNARRGKSRMAGLISQMFASFGGLTSSQVQSFFDLVAKEQSGGKVQHDTDLPVGESFSKAIQRQRPHWAGIWPAGQK